MVQVDADQGTIKNLTSGKSYQAKPLPSFIQEIIKAGGLMEYVIKKGY